MATEIVTAKAGTNHVDSEDIGALYAGGFGKGRYALNLGNNLKCSMRDANTLVIDTGGIMFDGRFVRVKTAESLTVTNGTQSQYRKDLAVLTYKRDASNNNIETVSWSVLRGTPASSESAAKVPAITEGSILDGDATASVAVAEVDLAGLTPTCKLLLPTVSSLSSLGESVSKRPEVLAKGKTPISGKFSNGYFTARINFTANVGRSDYILISSLVRNGVIAFHNIKSKDASGFNVYIGTTGSYIEESFVIDWIALKP